MKFTKTFSLVLVLVLLMGLTSCTSPAKTPEEAAEQFLTYFAKQKYNSAFDYVDSYDGFGFDDRDESGTKDIVDAVAKSMSFEIVGRTESETPVEIVAKVTTVDLRELYKSCTKEVTESMFSEALSEGADIDADEFKEKLTEAVVKAAESESVTKITTEVTFKMEEIDGSWFIVMDDLVFNNVCGHMNEANEWLKENLVDNGTGGETSSEVSEEAPTESAVESSVESSAESTPAE